MRIDIPNMVFSEKYKTFYIKEPSRCVECKAFPDGSVSVLCSWSKTNSHIDYFCHRCLVKIRRHMNGDREELFNGVIVMDDPQELPDDVYPVVVKPFSLVQGRYMDVFEAATSKNDGAVVIDRTKLAGRESFEGAQIGAPDMKAIEEKDKEVSQKEGFDLLDALREDEPILPERKNNLLADKERDEE